MVIHVVQAGETVDGIARRYGVSRERIISDNNLTDTQRLVVGQALLVLQPAETYTVQAGDTLASIAARFGVSEIVLLQYNPSLIGLPYLTAGQEIVIRFTEEKGREITVNGYAYPYIRLDVLEQTLPYLTYLTIFGYSFTETGELIGIDDQPLIGLAYQYRTAPVMLLTTYVEGENFSGAAVNQLFYNPQVQSHLLDNVVAVMKEKGYLGLDVDFEYVAPEDREGYLRFLENTVARMHENGFFVNVDLAPKISGDQPGLLYEAHDYPAIGALVDTVLIMTYEWGYTFGEPQAVAPINKVAEVVRYAVSVIPADKILMGIPNYGYDWILPFEQGVTRATAIGNPYAVEIASRYGARIEFDEKAQSPTFGYFDRNGLEHVVWFEDVRSIRAKYDLLDRYGLRGAGYWNVMRPFSQNWGFVSARYDIRKAVE